MTRVARRALALAVLAVMTTGCGAKVYEPGVYKGEKDPLLAVHAEAAHKDLLKQRFSRGQADR